MLGALCRVMEVSRTGYYAWRNRQPGPRAIEEAQILVHIQNAHQQSRRTYGSPRIFRELKEKQIPCSLNRVARIMSKHQISAATKRRRFVATTDSRHSLPVAQNLLDQQFGSSKPNTRWAADITYLWTKGGWAYLAVILDLYSRKVVGWAMSQNLDRSLVIAALEAALKTRDPHDGLICHTDRGSQYASGEYQERLSKARILCSMSRKGNCYDNAPVESFFATLKRELVHRTRFETHEKARQALFWWIEVWYNRRRRHSSLGYVSPEQFEQQQRIPIPMAA